MRIKDYISTDLSLYSIGVYYMHIFVYIIERFLNIFNIVIV